VATTAVPEVDKIISADDHMDLHAMPADVWETRLPAPMRERGPRVLDTDDGPYWHLDGQPIMPSGRKPGGLIERHQHGFRPSTPEHRLEDMDRDNVHTQVIYGPPGSLRFADKDLQTAVYQAYNDWGAEFNANDPDRLVLLPLIPSHDGELAAKELERCIAMGHRGCLIDEHVIEPPLWDASWFRFWDVADEASVPVSVHLGGGLRSIKAMRNSWTFPAMVAIIPMQLDEIVVGMIFSGVLEQRPNVTLVLGESGLGWIPYVLDRMDHEHHNYFEKTEDHRLSMTPRELFHRQVIATFEEDDLGIELIDRIGVDNVCWASDYPHGDSTWPNSMQAIMDTQLGNVAPDVRRKVIHDNAARIYNIAV
jgi:predicted TIM-barrel fold metal-dependent hydrolase